jgi:RNA polymerase sigma-70 factor (ECF subfamily)
VEIAQELIKRAGSGDMPAFEQLYQATSGFVYNVALRMTRNYADAQEVTQDVFLKIYRHLKSFRFRSAFKTWVYRITVNTAINRYRQAKKEAGRRADYNDALKYQAAGNSAAEGAIASDNKEILNKLLDRLIPEYKVCLILREIEGLSYQEIAAALRIPLNTVRSRLRRARQALLEAARGRGG